MYELKEKLKIVDSNKLRGEVRFILFSVVHIFRNLY